MLDELQHPWRIRGLSRRGSTLILVMWAVGICTLIVLSLQVSAFRQSAAGADAIGRVRAKWAARAGVEECIAYLGWEVEHAADSDPVRLRNALAELSTGEVYGASWEIGHVEDGEFWEGPLDAHARININLMTEEQLMQLDGMETSVARPIRDFIDDDDVPLEDGGVESQYYLSLSPSYEARNDAIRSLEELELVAGLDPLFLRGEDWNLNGLLDANENDGDLTWPPDNADNYLDGGWSALITAVSKGPGFGPSGLPKLMLATAELSEIMERMDVSELQAEVLKDFAAQGGNTLAGLITSPLSGVGGDDDVEVEDLTESQLRMVLDEGLLGGIQRNVAGKVNVNTAPLEVLELIPDVGPTLADQIIFARETSSRGFTNLLDLLDVPGMTEAQLVALDEHVDVRSNVYVITSRGRSTTGRTEVELVVTIDRSELPIRIIEYLER